MPVSGAGHTPDIQEIRERIKRFKGVASQVYGSLGIGHCLFYSLLKKYPELKEELDRARDSYEDERLDLAENVITLAMRKANEDMPNALSAAKFHLNNKGRSRGYNAWNEEKQAHAKSGLELFFEQHNKSPEEIKKLEADCKTTQSETDPKLQPSDQAD